MQKTLIALLMFVAASASAQTTVRCESTNGRYRECEVAGVGRIIIDRQLSDDSCIEGKTWGYRDGMVWVDKGCRADFTLVERGFGNRRGGTIVVCESEDGRRRECSANTRGGVSVVQQLSRASCVQGRSWGYTRDGIWVDEGCRAEFAVGGGRRDRGRPVERLDELVICESNGSRRQCPANTRGGVQLVRQISKSSCRFGRDWGYENFGVWVDNGCRAEFAVLSAHDDSATMPGLIVCSSNDGRRTNCPADTAGGVRLVRRLSDAECERNRTWGYGAGVIWVSGGCRAEFVVGNATSGYPSTDGFAGRGATIVCESRNDRRVHCPADTRWGVVLSRRLSDARCERNRTWGFDREGVWVDQGCRAEFVLDDRR